MGDGVVLFTSVIVPEKKTQKLVVIPRVCAEMSDAAGVCTG